MAKTPTARNDEGRLALLEVSFALSGLLKLLGLEARLFQRWGLSTRQMRRIGLMETAGALLVANERTRPIGATGLAAISALMLGAELRHREAELVLPRLVITGLAASVALGTFSARRA